MMAWGMAKARHGLMSFSPDAWLDFLSHVFLLHNFTPYILSINTVFWSIAIEVQLYLLYPLLMATARRIGWTGALLIVGAIEVGLRGFIGCYSVGAANPWGDVLDSNLGTGLPIWFTCSPFVYWLSWAIGAFVAEGYITKGVSPLAKTSWALWLFLAIAAYFFKITAPFSFLLFAVATATVIAKLMSRTTPIGSHVALRFGCLIGVWSYSLYLLHRPIIWAFAKWSHHSFLVCLTSLAISIPLSALFHRYCELPSIALGKMVLRGLNDWRLRAKPSDFRGTNSTGETIL
jgi:peptidoglycan/LPS O-acetylase OafA/YrhL